MEWAAAIGILAVVGIIIRFEWSNLSSMPKKEKVTFAVVTGVACLLSITLVFFPNIPGPAKWVEAVYKPMSKFLQ